MAKHVCIVGAGPAGIVAAKTLLYNAPPGTFRVTIYDAQKRVGGLWPTSKDDADGLVHPLMVTNQSRHTMHFSDFSWDPDDLQYPRAWMVGGYLERYLGRYPGADIKLGHRVVSTSLLDENKWEVTVQSDEGEENKSVFDHLLVATGFFGKPIIPAFVPEKPSVPVIHSSKYRDLRALLGTGGNKDGGKILIAGGQMSGVEVAGTIAGHLSSAANSPGQSPIADADKYTIHHLIQKPSWVFPLHTTPKPALAAPPFLPGDLGSYNLNNRPRPLVNKQGHITTEAAQTTNGLFKRAVGNDQSVFSESIAVKDNDTTEPPYLSMSQNYTEFVRSGLITATRGKLASLEGDTAVVQTRAGSQERIQDVRAVILATGFDPAPCVSFLPDSALDKLDFKPDCRDLPLALGFHGTQHRDLPTLGFVGFYRSPYWGVMEMQARFLAALWTASSSSLPPPEGVLAAVRDETEEKRTKSLRDDPRRSQFPMGDYPFIMHDIATALGMDISPSPDPPTPALPHNNLPMDIFTPSRYLSALADERAVEENAKALRQANEVAMAGLTSSRFVAGAVFRSLLGTWNLERKLESKLPSHPSGHFSGTARFLLRDATEDGLKGATEQPGREGEDDDGLVQEYLYVEEGEFRADNGLVFRAMRRYVWRYDERKDRISVWFAKMDDTQRADYLFHEILFEDPEKEEQEERAGPGVDGRGRGWKAKAGHLCVEDFYDVTYEFPFAAVNLEKWTIGYAVKGPKKDYTIQGVYTR